MRFRSWLLSPLSAEIDRTMPAPVFVPPYICAVTTSLIFAYTLIFSGKWDLRKTHEWNEGIFSWMYFSIPFIPHLCLSAGEKKSKSNIWPSVHPYVMSKNMTLDTPKVGCCFSTNGSFCPAFTFVNQIEWWSFVWSMTRHPFLKHDSSMFRQWSNPVCGSWKSWASSLWAKQHRA